MITYLFIYFSLVLFFVFFEKYLHGYKFEVYIFLGVCLILIAGLRIEGSDKDYTGYIKIIKGINEYQNYNIEPTFSIIKFIINNFLNGHVIFLFLFYASLGVTLKLVAIRQLTEFIFLSLLIYFSGFFILHEMTQIRAGIAAGFLLISIKPLYERKLKLFLILCLLASLFHYSAIVFFMLWFLKPVTFRVEMYFFLIPLSYLLHYLGFNISDLIKSIPIAGIQEKYNLYINMQNNGLLKEVDLFNSLQIFRILFALLLIFFYQKITEYNIYFFLLLKIFIIGICTLVLFADIPAIGARLSELLLGVEILLIPMILYIFKPKIVVELALVFIALGYICLNIFYSKLII